MSHTVQTRKIIARSPIKAATARPQRARVREEMVTLARLKLPFILASAAQLLKYAARRHAEFKARLQKLTEG